jgi:hypothetical protein
MLLDQAFLTDPNYYELLALEPSATHTDVQNAFQEESMALNLKSADGDVRLQAAEKMLQLTRAYETLSDPMMRARYDLQTLGRVNAPSQERIEMLFKEGIRAWKRSETDLALRYLKEVASLYPHRPLYRVHLAIAYAEKKWYNFTETELETALRLDPDYKFAKETIARLLFKVPDRQQAWFQSRLNQQVALMTVGFVGLAVFIASGIPGQMIQKLTGGWGQEKALDAKTIESQLPDDMKQALSENTVAVTQIPYFPADYKPAGQVFDYTKLEAVNKAFYAAQNTVAITYKDGSVLTYKPAELKGWKKVGDMPIMITANNELIPSPSSLPLKTGDGKPVDMNAFDFPQPYFPEYFDSPGATSSASTPAASTPAAPAVQAPANPPAAMQNAPPTSSQTERPPEKQDVQTTSPKVYNPYGN